MSSTQERRRFFRLDDQVTLDFKPLSKEQYSSWQEQNRFNRNNVDCLEKEINDLTHKIKSQNSDLGRLIELLNQKINTLKCLQNSESATIDVPNITKKEGLTGINLSACGMSFQSEKQYDTNEFLLLTMILKPSNTQISLAGQVIKSEKTSLQDKPFKIRINFPDIQEAEQELLIQHLFQLQTKKLKREHEQLQ